MKEGIVVIDPHVLEDKIGKLLDDFYKRRIEKIQTLELKDALRRKNPYLYRAIGVEKASEIVEEILSAYMSSSDEGIFGDAFFEPLARFVAGGDPTVGKHEGVDVTVVTATKIMPIAIKSGTNVFNAQSRARQMAEFEAMRKRLQKIQKQFDPVVGYAYGKKQQTGRSKANFRELAGQELWEEITGDADFYLKIIRLMKDKPQQHLPAYKTAYSAAVNRFTAEFVAEFCKPDYTIDWDKLVHFNSGKPVNKLSITPKSRTLRPGETLQLSVLAHYADDVTVDVTRANEVNYVCADPTLATVDSNGFLTVPASAQESDTTITVHYGGKSKVFKLKVRVSPSGRRKSSRKKSVVDGQETLF